jgi:hypothetical protein
VTDNQRTPHPNTWELLEDGLAIVMSADYPTNKLDLEPQFYNKRLVRLLNSCYQFFPNFNFEVEDLFKRKKVFKTVIDLSFTTSRLPVSSEKYLKKIARTMSQLAE